MDQKFSMEKQEFTIVKEKIIKTNELLSLYKEKNEKLLKATQAFKQLKSRYEAALQETNRLAMDNERLNYNLEIIKPKHEQCEKDLIEVRADYNRTDERYQQTMIDSQLTISELEEKVKHCTCEKNPILSPLKKHSQSEKVKELKKMCMELKEVESNLKNENDSLLLKNKELVGERQKNLRLIEDLTANKASLHRDLATVKCKLQKMELASKDQANLQLTLTCLKQNHEKEIQSLRMEISKLSLDNQKIRYLELECKNLKQHLSCTKSIKVEKADCCVQTEDGSDSDANQNHSVNIQKINTLEMHCKGLEKKLTFFENNYVSKQNVGIQTTTVEPIETPKVWKDDISSNRYVNSQKVNTLEAQCEDLKKKLAYFESNVSSKQDIGIQTTVIEAIDDSKVREDDISSIHYVNSQKVNTLAAQCEDLKKKLAYFESSVSSKQDIGIQTTAIEPIDASKVWEDDSLDYDYALDDIFGEMILPKAVSPFNFSTRSLESPTPPLLSMFESLSSDEILPPQEPFVQKSIPNIVITPPTPGVEKSSDLNVVFPIINENLEKQPPDNNHSNSGGIMEPFLNNSVSVVQEASSSMTNRNKETSSNNTEAVVKEMPSFDTPTNTDNSEMIELKTARAINNQNGLKDLSNKNELSTKSINSVAIDTNEITSESLLKDQAPVEGGLSFASTDFVSKCEKSVSTEEELEPLKIHLASASSNSNTSGENLQKESSDLKGNLKRRRKFWIPFNVPSFVKLRKKHPVRARVTKKYRETSSNQSSQNDTILNALRTLQQNNINFTISNESIPLIQPYNCYSLRTPQKPEPSTKSRKYTNTITHSLECWNKQCTVNNSKMLLRKVPNEEEPELLGFFSIKDEVITPSASRMAVLEQPKAFDPGSFVAQLLSGIKELVDAKRSKEPFENRKKRRSKSKNRRSDFYSETESELEKLFRNSADVLGRNRRFLEAAREQNFESPEESMFESEYDAMVDSGLVTGTPKIDTDSLSFCSELGVSDTVNLGIRSDQNISRQDEGLQNHTKDSSAPVKNNTNFVDFSSSDSNIITSADIFNNKTPSSSHNCTTPKIPTCPAMLSPIASSKGSPENLQITNTPLKTPESNSNSQISPGYFKPPFCPVMISPMASSKDSLVSQVSLLTKINEVSEDSLDCFKKPFCPTMASSLASTPINDLGNCSEKLTLIGSCKEEINLSVNTLHVMDYSKDYSNIKPSYSKNSRSSVCQKITFDSVVNNEFTDQSPNLVHNMDCDDHQEEFKSSLTDTDHPQSLEIIDVYKSNNVISGHSIIPESREEYHAEAADNKPVETSDESLNIDLSFKSSDLNYTLDDISISQLEISSAKHTDPNKLNEVPDVVNFSNTELLNTAKKSPKETKRGCVERRYSLRRKSQHDGAKKIDDVELEPHRTVPAEAENTSDFTSPRTRAAKRRMAEQPKNKRKRSSGNKASSSKEAVELAVPLKRRKGRPRKVDEITVSTVNKEISDSECLIKSNTKVSGLEKNPKKGSGDVEKVVTNNLLGSDSVEVEDVSSGILQPNESPASRNPKNINKLLKSRRKSKNSNEDISDDLVDWELQEKSDVDSKKHDENIVQMSQDFDRKTDKEITSNAAASEVLAHGIDMKITLPKKTETVSVKDDDIVLQVSQDLDRKVEDEITSISATTEELVDDIAMKKIEAVSVHDDENVQVSEDLVRRENEGIASSLAVNRDLLHGINMKTTLPIPKKTKTTQTFRKSRKFVSKEYISESESDCDISSKNHPEVKLLENVKKPFANYIGDVEPGLSDFNSINCQSSDLPTIKKNNLCKSEDHTGKPETTSRSDNDLKTSIQNNYSNIVTLEIQNMLRDLTQERSQSKNISLVNDVSRNEKEIVERSDASKLSERDLFGDISDNEKDFGCRSNKDLKEAHKTPRKKVGSKQSLRRKMTNQVRGMVYAYGTNSKNKDCDIVRNSCASKPIGPSSSSTSEESRSRDASSVRKGDKKINIVQNIVISKGKAINLLSSQGRITEPSSTASNSKAAKEVAKTLPPTGNGEKSTTISRKRIKMDSNISNSSTPVDILSQVMHEMVKTGPKVARKNISHLPNYLTSRQGRQPSFNHGSTSTKSQKDIAHDPFKTPWKFETTISEVSNVEVPKSEDTFSDCPKSPDIEEVPDRLPRLIPTEKPERLPASKVRAHIDRLMVFSNEAIMLDDVIKEFAFQDMTFMTEIIIDKLSQDYYDKADNSLPPSPPMTSTQRILLGFLLRLDKSTHPGIKDKFLSLAQLRLFNRKICRLEIVQPITRLYTAVCKLGYDLTRIRRFICEGFYFMEDFAITMFFTVLTMWPEVLPMESALSDNLLVKAIIQICYLKECSQPGYNLLPLRDVLVKYYGYPTERWNCEDIFKEIMVEFIRNPSIRLSDFTLLLYLRNKPTRWVYQKVKETIIPLYHQASNRNPNLKATLVILLSNICCAFNMFDEYDWSVILEMDRWFLELDTDDLDPVIKRSIHLARGRLPRRPRIRNKNKKLQSENTEENKSANKDNLVASKRTRSGAEDSLLHDTEQNNCEDSNKTNIQATAGGSKDENSESTNKDVNIDLRLDHNSKRNCEDGVQNLDSVLSKDEESDSGSDIEF